MSSFQSWLNKTKTGLQDQVGRFKNKDLLDAIVAGCALVSVADGTIDSAERQKMEVYIGRSEQLKVFNLSEAIDRFNHFAGSMEFDVMVGKQEALQAIAKFKSKPEVGRIVVGVCCAIGAADGDFDEQEKAAVRDICNVLNLKSEDFGL
ncbi:tellurite resistance TerB family protein [Saccharibacillus kuerlensis]|uniref:Tellurite resistance TerB n=1 Tax=Saccharibacillus kuerlensis TaxID=459527 RepID=A0ABQ2L0R1_9BACL|nr:tellurite resistance TerB family protein [Saccharibacillus kuerlensis]GGN98920.1 tellurite resistance TerB [Saccharibacillus kuerlensis]